MLAFVLIATAICHRQVLGILAESRAPGLAVRICYPSVPLLIPCVPCPQTPKNCDSQPANVHCHRIHVWYIYANIGGILMVNVTIYSIHGSYGIAREKTLSNPFCYNGQRGFSLLSDMKGNKERTPAYWMRNYLYFPTIFPKKNKLNTWWCNPKLKLTWCRNKVRPPGLRFSAHHLLNIWVD